jgi:DegV family protein with EDD domain
MVSDTVACLPPELVKEFGIRIVPVNIVIDGKSYRDGIDIDNDTFWKNFDSMKSFTTAAAQPGDFLNAFKEAGKEADNIICTTVTKALSATYQSAIQAKKLLQEENTRLNIEVVDSRTAIGAEAYVILEGARAARSGKNLAEVLQVMQDMITRAKWVNAMDTTKYLIKIGRAPKTLPTEVFLQMKPMIAMLHNTGVVEDVGVARSKEEAFQKMVDMIAQNTEINKPLHVFVHYTNNVEDGKLLTKMIQEKYKPVEMHSSPYTPVLCGTTGPCNAVAFYS